MKRIAMIHSNSVDRELGVTTTFHLWEDHDQIARALREEGVTPRRVAESNLGRTTIVGYDAGVRERDAIRWLAEKLRHAGFSPMLSAWGREPRPL